MSPFFMQPVNRTAILLLLVFFSAINTLSAQEKFTINGYIKDDASGEELIGAVISSKELPASGTATNAYGYFSLTLPAGTYNLVVTYVGYRTQVAEIVLNSNQRKD